MDNQQIGRSGADAPSGSQASPGAAAASPPSVSIPNADALLRHARKAARCVYLATEREPADDIAYTLLLLVDVLEATERALRNRIWNTCKGFGVADQKAYAAINLELDRVFAQAIEARRAATAKTGAVEDESAVGNADAPTSRPSHPIQEGE